MCSLLSFRDGDVGTFAIVAQVQALFMPTPIQVIKPFSRAKASIGFAGLQQSLDVIAIGRKTLRLAVGTVGPIDYRTYLDLATDCRTT